MARFAVGLSLAILVTSFTFAQIPSDPAAGNIPFATQIGGTYDVVDLATSNILVTVPVRAKNEKIPFAFALFGNSHAYTYPNVNNHNLPQWAISSSLVGRDSISVFLTSSTRTITCGSDSKDTESYNFAVVDFSGAAHALPSNIKIDNDGCDPSPVTGMTSDGTGYTMQIAPTSQGPPYFDFYVWNRSGIQVLNNFTGVVTDPDGTTESFNSNTGIYTDSLNTQVLKVALGGGGTQPDKYTYTGGDGNNNDGVTVSNAAYHQKTVFGCSATDLDATNTYFPSSISIVGGGRITLTYETTPGYAGQKDSNGLSYVTGRIASITYPSGGSVTYGYSGGNNGINCSSQVVPTLTRTVNDNNGNNGTWTYVNSNTSATVGNFTVTETDPANNQTVYNFSGEYQTQAVYHQGTSTVLKTVMTCYNGNTSSCAAPGTTPALPITETDVYTSLGASLSNRVTTTFDSTYGNVLSISNYDWGGSPKLSVTNISYGSYSSGSGCTSIGSYINDHPCVANVYDGSNNLYSQVATTYGATGHATSVLNWVGGTTSLQTTNSYNTNGTLAWTKDPAGNQTTFGYAATGSGGCNALLLTSTTYALSSVGADSQTWDCNGGVISTKTDVNSNVTSFVYNDPLYRLTKVTYPDSSSDTLAISYNTGNGFPWYVTKTKAVNSANSESVQTNLNGLGRPILSANLSDPNGYNYQATVYNNLGQVYTVSNPYYSTSDATYGLTTYGYDALGRTTSIAPPVSNDATTISYSNRASEVIHAGVSKVYQSDGLGRTVNVCEVTNATPAGGPTPSACGLDITPSPNDGFLSGLNYDPLGRVTAMCAGASQCRNFAYDGMSRLTSETYPESGTKSYTYDTGQAGDLYQRVAPKENQTGSATVVTTYAFDTMHRLTGVSYNDGTTLNVGLVYDKAVGPTGWGNNLANGKGRLSWLSTSLGGGTFDGMFGYDAMGRVNLYGQCSPQNCTASTPNHFVASYLYNFVGEPAGGSDIQGGVYWTNTYDAIGRLSSIWNSYLSSNLVSNITYNALGEMVSDSLASGKTESWSYDTEGRSTAYSVSPSFYNYGLTYSPTITSSTDSVNGNYSYTYDDFGRLATAGNGTNNFSYGYDRWGNRWNQTRTKGSGPNPTYNFTSNNQIASGNKVFYDAAGNISNDGFHSYTYDAEGRLLTVDGTGAAYTYNSRGQRVGSSYANAEYLLGLSGERLATITPGTTTVLWNDYFISGRHWGDLQNGTTFLLYSDWLGTLRKWDGLSSGQGCTNLPFGDLWSCTGGTIGNNGFASMVNNPESTTNEADNRQQTPTEGRWLTPDPAGVAVMDVTNPQTWNRYAYVMNNTVSNIDPTGLACWPFERTRFGSCAGFMGNGVNFGSNWNEFGILASLLGPGQTGVVTATIGGVPVSETATYYGGDLSLLNLIGGSDSWGWNFTKSLFGGFSLSTKPGTCLGVFVDTASVPLKQVQSAAKNYIPLIVGTMQSAPSLTTSFGSYMQMVGDFTSTPTAETAEGIAGLYTVGAAASTAASYVSAAAPYAVTGGADLAFAYGLGAELKAGANGRCTW
jgi:RHS repeat-associated protein